MSLELSCRSTCNRDLSLILTFLQTRNSFFSAMAGSSPIEELQPQHQVFINYRGADLRYGFVSYLVNALERNGIKVFTDTNEVRSQSLEVLWKRIEGSRIALVIFTKNYTESTWCLRELAKIVDCVKEGKMVAIPIFYKLEPPTVMENFDKASRYLTDSDATKKMWKKALTSIIEEMGIVVKQNRDETKIVENIVHVVKRVLSEIPSEGSQESSVDASENIDTGTFGIKQRLKELGDKLDLNKITSQLGMIIGFLLLLFFCLPHIAYMSTRLLGEGRAINGIMENVPKVLESIPAERTENSRDKFTEFPTAKFGTKPESSSSDAKTNADFLDRTRSNSPMDSKVKPPKIQVFINFRGYQLRNNFVGYLVDALRRSEINVFIDTKANIGDDLINLFKSIEDSGIAIVVFSSRYTESEWCLNELVKIKERVQQGLLKVLPIFYKVTPGNVKRLKGEFGDNFRDKEYMYASDEPKIKRWKEAIVFVSHKFALTFDEKSSVLEIDFIETIVKEVLKMLQAISTVESGQSSI